MRFLPPTPAPSAPPVMEELRRLRAPVPSPPPIILEEPRRWRLIIAPVDAPPPMKTASRFVVRLAPVRRGRGVIVRRLRTWAAMSGDINRCKPSKADTGNINIAVLNNIRFIVTRSLK
jgi:uncharacterized protein with NAD-binding domain and iron-sulfur cluster